jgi:hypothetical protein
LIEPVDGLSRSSGVKKALQWRSRFMLAGSWRFSHPAGVFAFASGPSQLFA